MTIDAIIEETVKYVQQELVGMEAGHDWYHIERVWKNAKQIMKHEKKVNSLVVTLWALLHDIAEAKFYGGDESIWPKKAKEFLERLWVEKNNIEGVIDIVENISFKNEFEKSSAFQAFSKSPQPSFSKRENKVSSSFEKGGDRRSEDSKIGSKKSLELQIVQDADRLDALGAIGIARAFTYGGIKWRELYNPEIKPKKFKNKEEYKQDQLGLTGSTTINHFYEKLFLLKDMMNTKTWKKLAKKRHRVMVSFVKEFKAEWKGKK